MFRRGELPWRSISRRKTSRKVNRGGGAAPASGAGLSLRSSRVRCLGVGRRESAPGEATGAPPESHTLRRSQRRAVRPPESTPESMSKRLRTSAAMVKRGLLDRNLLVDRLKVTKANPALLAAARAAIDRDFLRPSQVPGGKAASSKRS